MGENKNKDSKETFQARHQLISKVFKLRKRLNLPTDEHHKKFFESASVDEIKEILLGLEELALIFGNLEKLTVRLD